MIKTFPDKFICNKFHDIRILLYKADGRIDVPPDDLIDFKQVDVDDLIEPPYKDLNENSKIPILPAMTLMEVHTESIDTHNIEYEIVEHKKDFLNFPFEIGGKSDRVEIAYYFYYYSDMSKKDPIKQAMMESIVLENFAMRRSDFLYMMIFRKFVKMESHYQDFLKGAREYFQFSMKTPEVIVLNKLVNYYSDILKSTELQLILFSYVLLSKQIADLYAKILVEYFTLKLNDISPDTEKHYIVDPIKNQKTVTEEVKKPILEITSDFSFTDRGIKSKVNDVRQTAVLFHYLRKHGAFLDYSDDSYSRLLNFLTGHSNNTARREKGFGNMTEILREERYGDKFYNTKIIKSLLERIIADIDDEIKKKK